MRSKPLAAGLAMLGMTALPAGMALAEETEPSTTVGTGLEAQLNGHTTAAAELRSAADDLRARRARAAARRVAVRAAARERAEQRALARVPAHLKAIAQCESGGNPSAIGGGGLYRGKYQFSRETWAAVGGSGDPAQAPEAEQDRRAIQLYAQAGAGQWPACGS